jgi:hypothetical protein
VNLYVIINNTNGRYVATPGSKSAFTTDLKRARVFSSRERARAESCVDSEYVANLDSILPTPRPGD